MNNHEYYTVVVIYNQTVDNSTTCENIKKIKGHKINNIIVDNSTKENNNSAICKKNGWVYLSQGKNIGLSKGYNLALDYLKGKSGVVIWFDDDTNVTQEYFDELDKIVTQTDSEIIAPVILAQNGKIYSPNEARFLKNRQLRRATDKLNMQKFNAINSCTAVRLTVYEEYRYNERLFLDQVDHNFFDDQRNKNRSFYKMDTVINHDFSLKGRMKDMESLKNRYRIMIPDFLVYCSKGKLRLLLGWVKIFGWGIREAVKYRDWSFMMWCIREAMTCSKNNRKLAKGELL
jgi:hypothetical protein